MILVCDLQSEPECCEGPMEICPPEILPVVVRTGPTGRPANPRPSYTMEEILAAGLAALNAAADVNEVDSP